MTDIEALKAKTEDHLTLADHCELWAHGEGKYIPPRETHAWQLLYESWVDFAFADFAR